MQPKLLLRILAVTIVLALLVPMVFAQETTAGLQGVVKDASGAVVAKAVVEVTSPALIGKKVIETDASGYYRFANLPPGTYTLVVTAANFRTHKQEGIDLTAGRLPSMDVVLQIGAAAEVVEVTGEAPIVDVTQSKVSTTVTEEQIASVPKGRSFANLITMAPGARQEPLQSNTRTSATGATAAGFSIDGASDSENTYLVEGMDTTGIAGGGIGQGVPTEFIQEVQVKTSGYEAEFGGALGGVVNVIQKRGGNVWHGSVWSYFRTDALNANDQCAVSNSCGLRYQPGFSYNSSTRTAPPAEYYLAKKDHRRIVDPGFEAGGYLLKDKLWFFTSYAPTFDRLGRTVNFSKQSLTSNNGPRTLNQRVDVHNALTRLDYALSSKVRLYAAWQYGYERDTGTNLPSPDSITGQINNNGTTDVNNYRADYGAVYPENLFNFGGDITVTPKLVVTARYGYWFNNAEYRGRPTGIRYYYYAALSATGTDLSGAPIAGSPAAAYVGTLGTSNMGSNTQTVFNAYKRKTFSTDASYFVKKWGTHNFKFGYQHTNLANDQKSAYNSALVELYWLQPYSPQDPAACASHMINGSCGGKYGYYTVSDYETGGLARGTNDSIYGQDAWTLGKGITLNAGVRFDKEYLPPYSAGAPDISFGFTQKAAPRIGGSWDVLGNGKWKVYGSFGYFYDIMKYSLPAGSFGGEYWHDCTYTLDDPNYNNILPAVSNGHTCGTSGAASGTTTGQLIENVNFRSVILDPNNPGVDPNIHPMKQHEFAAGTDYEINPKLALEIRYNRKRLDYTIEDNGVSVPGNELYFIGNPGYGIVQNLLQRSVTDSSNYPANVTYAAQCPNCNLEPRAIRNYDGLEVRLTKRPSKNWWGQVSYTYSRLYGNYSGLTSSDVNDAASTAPGAGGGRHNPNNNRSFDLPQMQFTAYGKPQFGPLATDRPHTLKMFGAYTAHWWNQETTLALAQVVYSGTPQSTCVPEVNTQSACQFVENRGNWVVFGQDSAGNLVKNGVLHDYRSPAYTQTDLNFSHALHVSKTNEHLKLQFEMNVFNVLNQHAVLSYMNTPFYSSQWITPVLPGTSTTDWMAMTTTGFNYVDVANGINNAGGGKMGLTSIYGKPNLFQNARNVRLGMKFFF